MFQYFIQGFFFGQFHVLAHARTDYVYTIPVDSHDKGYFVGTLVHADEHGQQFFVAGQLRITFAELGQIRRMYGGKRPAECVLIFPAEQALHGELANGVEVIGSHGPFYFFRQLFVAAVQVLLPGNEGLYFPFVVFYKLVVGFPSDDEIGCSGDK